MIPDKTSSNHVVEIISGITPSCDKRGCGTCGGYALFKKRLDEKLPNREEINNGLASMNAHVAR
jgi:hypothetical protein